MILQQPFAITPFTVTAYVRTLTIDADEVPSTQTDFPVLVNFTDNTFKTEANGGHVFDTNCFTFSSDSGGSSLLKWEVDRYNGSTGEIVAWVKIASVDGTTDTVFYLRYGPSITTDQSDATNVWTNNFRGVWHLGNGSSLVLTDSSGGGFTLTNNNTVTAGTGQIDGASVHAKASSQYLSNATIGVTTAITVSFWFNQTGTSDNNAGMVVYRSGGGYVIAGIGSATTVSMFVFANADVSHTGWASFSNNVWNHYVVTYNSTSGLRGYLNGVADSTCGAACNANGNLNTGPTTINIGRDSFGTRYFEGKLDEVRVANVARSADWVTCEYNNQKDSQTFIALGSETPT